jgi:hypothetical protein
MNSSTNNFVNGVKKTVSDYLSTHKFVPHKNGNSMNYGLNSFGCESIIKYNGELWQFIWFLSDTNIAVYVNQFGDEFHYNVYKNYDMTRMMEVE